MSVARFVSHLLNERRHCFIAKRGVLKIRGNHFWVLITRHKPVSRPTESDSPMTDRDCCLHWALFFIILFIFWSHNSKFETHSFTLVGSERDMQQSRCPARPVASHQLTAPIRTLASSLLTNALTRIIYPRQFIQLPLIVSIWLRLRSTPLWPGRARTAQPLNHNTF